MAIRKSCPECGYPLQGNEPKCPECGYPLQVTPQQPQPAQYEAPKQKPAHAHQPSTPSIPPEIPVGNSISNDDGEYKTFSQLFWGCQFAKLFKGQHFDLGQRLYEAFEWWWEMVVFTWKYFWSGNFCKFSGRATRREYFSYTGIFFGFNPFFMLTLYLIVGFIPFLGISVRRMHDIGRSGWWVLCPVANLFFLFKKSDEGINRYGSPSSQQW